MCGNLAEVCSASRRVYLDTGNLGGRFNGPRVKERRAGEMGLERFRREENINESFRHGEERGVREDFDGSSQSSKDMDVPSDK